MKKLLPLLLLILIGCSEPIETVEESLLKNKNGLMFINDSQTPFSGIVSSNYSSVKYIGTYENGFLKEMTFLDINDNNIEILNLDYNYSLEKLFRGQTVILDPFTNLPYTGPFKSDDSNQDSFSGNSINGNLHGLFEIYFENGLIDTEVTFRYGKLDGPFKEYYENGGVRDSGFYKMGEFLEP
tara:strand:+ start:371 stop:919 length:549 start_codon:yes stop_codon:yes gene_type:complete